MPGGEKEQDRQVVRVEGEADRLLEGGQEGPVHDAEGLEDRGGGLQGEDDHGHDPRRGPGAAGKDVDDHKCNEGQQEYGVAHRLPPNMNAAMTTTAAAPARDQKM